MLAVPSIIALLPVSRESSQASVGARVSESVSIKIRESKRLQDQRGKGGHEKRIEYERRMCVLEEGVCGKRSKKCKEEE